MGGRKKSTKVELVAELRERAPDITRRWGELQALIKRAEAGYYHCVETPIGAPKVQLVEDLRHVGLEDIATRVIAGEFDEPFTQGR